MNEKIEEIVSRHFGINRLDLKGAPISRKVTDAKHFLWYILCDVMGYNARFVAGHYRVSRRNVLYSVSQIRDGVRMQPFYANHYKEVLKELKELELI